VAADMAVKYLHPAAVLTLWAGAAVFFQSLPSPAFWWGAVCVVGVAVFAAPLRFWRLLRRIRVLLVVSVMLFALATPGVRLLPELTWLALTRDGIVLGCEHALRLVMMVALVAWLLERMTTTRLICALHALFRPLAPFGVSAERIAVRLSLVLQAVGDTGGAWRAWFVEAETAGGPAHVAVDAQQWHVLDRLVVLGVLGGLIIWSLL
jgi:energy-coupling factor transporter transmembrane protein EcfT